MKPRVQWLLVAALAPASWAQAQTPSPALCTEQGRRNHGDFLSDYPEVERGGAEIQLWGSAGYLRFAYSGKDFLGFYVFNWRSRDQGGRTDDRCIVARYIRVVSPDLPGCDGGRARFYSPGHAHLYRRARVGADWRHVANLEIHFGHDGDRYYADYRVTSTWIDDEGIRLTKDPSTFSRELVCSRWKGILFEKRRK